MWRGPGLHRASSTLAHFQQLLGKANVITSGKELAGVTEDWMRKYRAPNTPFALQPGSTAEVAAVLRHCHQQGIRVVPQGGNTGLAGGSVPMQDEVVLLTRRLKGIRSFDKVSGVLVCGAGHTLAELAALAGPEGYEVPLDLGPRDQCQIGGNLSTNAGGVRLLRYGPLRGAVLGLEVALMDGTVLDLLQTVRKDNTGYALAQLFVGAEGTLGVITAASLLLAPKPAALHAAFLAVPSFEAALEVFVKARQLLGEVLSAFEFLDRQALALTLRELPEVAHPLPGSQAPIYLLVETAGSNRQHDEAKLQEFMRVLKASQLATACRVATDAETMHALWHLRKNISTALRHSGQVLKYDLSLPPAAMYRLVEETRARLQGLPRAEVVAYGHLGDQNLHLNVSMGAAADERVLARLEPFVYEWTARHRGSISAEHGLGQMKNEYLGYSKPAAAVHLMARLKRLLDPGNLLNPGKVLPSGALAALDAPG